MGTEGVVEWRGSAWWRVPFHPAAITVALVTKVWAAVAIHPAALYRPLIVAVIASLVLTVIVAALSRSRDLGALGAAGILLAIIATSVPAASIVVLIAVLLLVVLGLIRAGRRWALGERVTRGMNIVGAILMLATAINLVQTGALTEGIEDIRLDLQERPPVGIAKAGAPDIYVILLDGYPGTGARALDRSFPPSRLRDDLTKRGFDMTEDSHSNYLLTAPTLVSMMQMRHLGGLPELARPWGPDASDSRRLRRLLNDAPALDRLREGGYTTPAIASGFADTELRRVDRLIESIAPTELEVGLLRGTGLGAIMETVTPDLVSAAQRGRINDTFEALASIPSIAAEHPRFVLGHIPAPHPPWVFRADGSSRREDLFFFYTDSASERRVDRIEALAPHLEQAAYVDSLIVKAIDRILADSSTPPVIVLFSDHGPGTGFDQRKPLESDLVERASTVIAALTPGHPRLFAEPTTPIAIMPRLLNAYLALEIPVPEDSIWAWRDSKLEFVPVDLDAQP